MKALCYEAKPLGWLTCLWLKKLWPGCLLSRLGGLTLRELDPPALPGDDWVLVRTLLGGICGTDLGILAQKQPPNSILQAFSSLPLMLGHENVAVVESVGPAVDKGWLGRRVCVEPTLGCTARGIEPACPRCQAGQFGACENFSAAGAGRYKLPAGTSIGYNNRTGGSFGEFFVAHVSQLVDVPASVSDELAVLTDPLACSLHSVLRADLSRASQVLVYGAGVLGLGVIACLRATGYAGRIDALEVGKYLQGRALRLGADAFLQPPREALRRYEMIAERTGARVHRVRLGNLMLSGGYDVIFECVGSVQSLNDSLKWAAGRGQVVLVGTGSGGRIDLTPLWFRELTVVGAYGRQLEHAPTGRVGTYQWVHRLMAEGKLPVADMLTHKFPLAQYRQALTAALHKSAHGAVKVAFDFRKTKETS